MRMLARRLAHRSIDQARQPASPRRGGYRPTRHDEPHIARPRLSWLGTLALGQIRSRRLPGASESHRPRTAVCGLGAVRHYTPSC